MAATVLSMSMSLDGFIAGPKDGPGNGLGDNGDRVHEWMWPGDEASGPSGIPSRPSGANGAVFDELMATGAVVVGRRTFDLAGGWAGDHHDGVPIFVLTRHEPDADKPHWPLVIYVSVRRRQDAPHGAGVGLSAATVAAQLPSRPSASAERVPGSAV